MNNANRHGALFIAFFLSHGNQKKIVSNSGSDGYPSMHEHARKSDPDGLRMLEPGRIGIIWLFKTATKNVAYCAILFEETH